MVPYRRVVDNPLLRRVFIAVLFPARAWHVIVVPTGYHYDHFHLAGTPSRSTLTRTSYFAILDRTREGGGTPRLVCPLIATELRNKDERKVRDVLNLTITDFTTLGQVFDPTRASLTKMSLFGKIKVFWRITFKLRMIEKHETPRHSSRRDSSKHMHLDLEMSIRKK